MENINDIIAENLRNLRVERKMSLDAVAKASGVSKSMLGQIERGDVNPTISTVWKIANGLKVPFTDFTTCPEKNFEVIYWNTLQPLTEDKGKFRNYPLFPFSSTRRFEMFYIELDPDAFLEAEAHPDGAQEFITAFSGILTVTVNRQNLTIQDGAALCFKADYPHTYHNPGNTVCRLSMVIYYPN